VNSTDGKASGSGPVGTRVRILAVLVPLAVVSNRFIVYPQLFFNDFAVAAIAVVLLLFYGVRLSRRSFLCVAGLFLFLALHSAAHGALHPEMRESIVNNFARIAAALVDMVAFCSFYSSIPVTEAIAGLRRTAWVLSITIVLHLMLLNFAGDFGRHLALLQQHEITSAERDSFLAGYLRPFGITAEPAVAGGCLFLMASLLQLARPGKWQLAHWVFLISALVTGAGSMLLFAPIWLYLMYRYGGRRRQVLGILVVSFCLLFCAASVQVTANIERAFAILTGEDMSASLRLVPMVRTIAGTVMDAPLTGFGVGQSRLADRAGSRYIDVIQLPDVETERSSGVVFVEMLGDFGVPGLFALAALLYFCALPAKRLPQSWWWLVCILLTQNCYVYTNPQLYYWCSLGIVLLRSRRLRVRHCPSLVRRLFSHTRALHSPLALPQEAE
jgi:hypothetical protein